MNTSLRNCISIFSKPAPRHLSHWPWLELKLKALALRPRCLARSDCAKTSRMSSNAPTYTAGFDLGVLPRMDWSTRTTRSNESQPVKVAPPAASDGASVSSESPFSSDESRSEALRVGDPDLSLAVRAGHKTSRTS